jgi:hypothetical protein
MDILQVFGQTLQVSENPESMIIYRPELKAYLLLGAGLDCEVTTIGQSSTFREG